MNKDTLAALIERVEQATSEQQGEVIATVLMTARKTGWLTSAQYSAALHMLVAKAYESAALALVPEGWGWSLHSAEDTCPSCAYCVPHTKALPWPDIEESRAATSALALVAAALRAKMESAE